MLMLSGWPIQKIVFAAVLAMPLTAAEDSPVAITQKLFDAMKGHDSASATALFVPGATLSWVAEDGKATIIPFEKWADRLGTSKKAWLERLWNPKVLENGSAAVVWGEYDFHLDGKLDHCGVDSFQLLRTGTGWKIASVSFTHQTTCAPSPLGPPVQ